MLVLVCSPLLTSHNGTNSYPLEGGIPATFQHVSDVACSCFFWGGFGVCFLMFCRSLVVSLNSLNQARFPHMSSPTMCLVFWVFSPISASFLFYFLLFPSISIDDMGATAGVCVFFSFFCLFPNGFLLCDHGQDL